MSEVKSEGLEVVATLTVSFDEGDGGSAIEQVETHMLLDEGAHGLCRHSEALAGYAVRDARIATQEAQTKELQGAETSWQSGYDEGRRMGGKHCALTIDQLRAELAALNAKLDASKFCADVADDQQVSVPDCFESYRLADKFCEQRLVTDDHVRAIVVDAFASGYGFGIAAAPVAKPTPIPDHVEDVRTMVLPDGYRLVPIEPTAAQCFTAAFNLCNEFGDEFVRDNKQFALAAYRSLVAASPSAKGGE